MIMLPGYAFFFGVVEVAVGKWAEFFCPLFHSQLFKE
jgi:hypothetical protein